MSRSKRDGASALDRAEAMRAMYVQGVTLAAIGEKYNVTRERVRQILSAQFGITGRDGGQAKVSAAKRERIKKQSAMRLLQKWGLTPDEWREYSAKGLIRAYRYQRNNADHRGIEFKLTFPEWLSVWQASGKLDQRGRGKDSYCMSRLNDSGAYELGNVHIQTNAGNGREALKQWVGARKKNRGVFCLYPGTDRPYVARVGRVQVARCATEEEAASIRAEYCIAQGLPVDGGGMGRGKGWTYVKSMKARPYMVQVLGTKSTYHPTQEEAEAEYRRRVAAVLVARAPDLAKPAAMTTKKARA